MKIRNRLALIFTSSAAFILVVVILSVYYLSDISRKNDFFNRLKERVQITEQLFLEKENIDDELYLEIREKFLHTLPEEIEIVEKVEDIVQYSTLSEEKSLPSSFLKELLANGYAEFQDGKKQGAGQVYQQRNQSYAVIVTAVDQYGIAHSNNLLWLLIIGFIISILFIFLSGRLFAKEALKPIAMKIKKAQRIGAVNIEERLIVYNEKDELGQLAIAFNGMLNRLQEAFETQKNFIRNASHEIKNPLTTIIGEAEVVLERKRSSEEYTEAIKNINKEAYRLNELANNFLNLAKSEYSEYEKNFSDVRVDEILLEAKQRMDHSNPGNKIIIDFSNLPTDQHLLIIKGNADLIKAAIINLLDNACKFSQNQEVKATLTYQKNSIQLLIEDKGIGIQDVDKNKIFQPLYRADNARAFKGTGLGLSIVYRIAELHKASIKIKSVPNEGTVILLSFPLIRTNKA